jgi:hypothetical protein
MQVSQEERSIFWEVTVSVILSKKCICTCVLFRTVSEIVQSTVHCTDEQHAMSSHELQSYSERFPRQSYFTVQYTVHCTDEQHAMSSHELQSYSERFPR